MGRRIGHFKKTDLKDLESVIIAARRKLKIGTTERRTDWGRGVQNQVPEVSYRVMAGSKGVWLRKIPYTFGEWEFCGNPTGWKRFEGGLKGWWRVLFYSAGPVFGGILTWR